MALITADAFTQFELFGFEVFCIPAQRPECAARQAAGLTGDLLAGCAKGLAAELHDMEKVEANPPVGEVFTRTGDEGFGHVDGAFLDLRGVDFAPGELGSELVEGRTVLEGCEEEQVRDLGSTAGARGFLAGDFEKYGAVFMAFADGCLIDAETFERTPVDLFPNLLDAAADELPDAVDSVVHRAGFAGFLIDETAAGFEVDDEFKRLRHGIEISGNENGSQFRILTVVDQNTGECLLLGAGQSMRGQDVLRHLTQAASEGRVPAAITVDNGSEFYSDPSTTARSRQSGDCGANPQYRDVDHQDKSVNRLGFFRFH